MSAARVKRAQDVDPVPYVPQVPAMAITVGSPGHDFTLQAIVGLEKSVAELSVHMQGVKTTVDGLKSKVDDLVAWKNRILGGFAMLLVAGAAVGYLAGKASDYVTFKVPATFVVPAPVAPLPAK